MDDDATVGEGEVGTDESSATGTGSTSADDTSGSSSGPGSTTGGGACTDDPGQIGDPCVDPSDCENTPGMPFCQAGFWSGGYCMDGTGDGESNCDPSQPTEGCPPCTICTTLPFFGAARCVRVCESDEDCRADEGYVCQPADDPELSWCGPQF